MTHMKRLTLLLLLLGVQWVSQTHALAATRHGPRRPRRRGLYATPAAVTSSEHPTWERRRVPWLLEDMSLGHGPRGRCAPECTERGGVCNEELGRCDCPRGFTGPDCANRPKNINQTCGENHFMRFQGNCTDDAALPEPVVCLNGCNGRGNCRAGWCQCQPGYWGTDCSLSRGPNGRVEVLAGQGYSPRQKRPLIYVYDLPHRLTTWRNPHFFDRPLHIHFQHRLLASGALTADPEQADFYFFPVSVRNPGEGLWLESAVNYVRVHWPYWDRYAGARHLVIHTGDTGRAEMAWSTIELTRNCTFLTHWGLTERYPFSGWPASHIPDQDIVIPIYLPPLTTRASGLHASPLHPLSPKTFVKPEAKDIQLLFAGRICGGREEPNGTRVPNCRPLSMGYSQGVRQEVHRHHWNRTGFRISVSNPRYFEELARTRFCLSPTGGGHGHRQILVAFSGCTPLVISDHVLQPFEPALNWTRFAVRLPQSTIPMLHLILPTFTNQQYQDMQDELPCAAQHFTWSTTSGAFMQEAGAYDAFETTLEILRMMVKYPGVPHAEFEGLDPEFRAFMTCRSHAYHASLSSGALAAHNTTSTDAGFIDSRHGQSSRPLYPDMLPSQMANPLCSLSRFDDPAECADCLMAHRRMVPGGALCCKHTENLAACPRLWE